ncbi:MAG: TIGR03936 family radical SAM-associated protein [Anaerolineae bacterium]|nr:TIGR03936 family radical SAM-associated protein [Anaerolineae bacterium]MDW8300301.1 TIGR03936 family radical SAM-associated protein [Anaerolineae bacterium]
MSERSEPVQRLRITFAKRGAMKFIGHLDLAKTWERILRRAQLALAYTQGFNARPRIQLASPLPLGLTSECELLDVWLERPEPLEGLPERLMAVSPPDLPVLRVEEVPLRAPALQTVVESAVFRITPRSDSAPEAVAGLPERVAALMAQPQLLRTRRDKAYDLKPLIRSLEIGADGALYADLYSTSSGTGRPDELLEALGYQVVDFDIQRVAIRLSETPISAAAVPEDDMPTPAEDE